MQATFHAPPSTLRSSFPAPHVRGAERLVEFVYPFEIRAGILLLLDQDPGLDQRADIYALGCILYEMLTGGPPYTGRSLTEVAGRILRGPVPSTRESRDDVPAAVDGVIRRALAKVPADRFATMEELAAALPRA